MDDNHEFNNIMQDFFRVYGICMYYYQVLERAVADFMVGIKLFKEQPSENIETTIANWYSAAKRLTFGDLVEKFIETTDDSNHDFAEKLRNMVETRNTITHKLVDITALLVHDKNINIDIHRNWMIGILLDTKSTTIAFIESHKEFRKQTDLESIVVKLPIEKKEAYQQQWRTISEQFRGRRDALKSLEPIVGSISSKNN